MKLSRFLMLILLMYSFHAYAQTINLSLNTTPYCASAQVGNAFTGVVPGVCTYVPPVEPVGRLRTASVRYPNVSSTATLANVPMTDWTVFGRGKTTDPITPPYGQPGSAPAIFGYPGSGYVAWCFVPPSPAQVTVGVSTYYGWLLDYAWSKNVGDFHPQVGCSGTSGAGQAFLKLSTAPGWGGCPAPVGETICLNTRLHVPQTPTATVQFNFSLLKH